MIQGPVHRAQPAAGGASSDAAAQARPASDAPKGPRQQSAGPELRPDAPIWQAVGFRPSYIEDVPSGAATSVLELVVQDAERRACAARSDQANFAARCRYYARRMGTLLAESDRLGDTQAECVARLLRDPYIGRVTPELDTKQLAALIDNAPKRRAWKDKESLATALMEGPPSELAIHMVRDALPASDEIAGFTQTPDVKLDPEQIADGQGTLLFFSLVRAAPPTWNLDRLLDVYNQNVSVANGSIAARHMSRDDLELTLAEAPWIRQEYELQRFHFRQELKAAIAHAPVGLSLGDAVRGICRYNKPSTPGYQLDASEVLAYVRGDPELQRLINAQLGPQLLGMHEAVLTRLARWVRSIYGDRLHDFSLLEIADRMQREDPAFTPALLAELFARCPEILGRTPEANTRRNFLLAVTVATTMQRMWPGATYQDVITFLKALGPHADVPPGLTVEHVRLLQGYDFVPVWPDGVKPDAQASLLERQLGDLAPRIDKAASMLYGGMGDHLKQEIAAMLGERGPPNKARIETLVADCFRPTLTSRALRVMERYGGKQNIDVVNYVIEALSAGRYDELLENTDWRTAFRPARGDTFEPAGKGVPEYLTELIRSFRDAERTVASAVELAIFRNQTAMAAMGNVEKIPRVLPITQGVVDAVQEHYRAKGEDLPLSRARVVMLQHELGQAYPQVEAYKNVGMDPSKCIFVGKPYHPNPAVEQALLEVSGIDGRFLEQGDLDGMQRVARDAVDEAIAKREPGEIVLVVGDGPMLRHYVEQTHFARDPELARYVRFTEQTAIGHRAEDVARTDKRVVSFARLYQKLVEAPYIGRAGRRAVEAVLANLRDTLENKQVWVNGIAGPIGMAVAEALQAAGARIAGWDPAVTDETRAWAKSRGIEVFTDDSHLPEDVFMIAGAAGAPSISKEQIDKTKRRRDGGPVYYVSFSSERVEFEGDHMEQRATDARGVVRKAIATWVNDQPTYYYLFDDGSVRVSVADRLPANFQDVNSVAPEAIDATMGLSVASAVEACEGDALGFFSASTYVGVVEGGHAKYLARAGASGATTTPILCEAGSGP